MGKQFAGITDKLRAFIEAQHVFFVATAARDGRVNVSPKGLDSLRVLGPDRVVWVNAVGSGNETAAHLLDTPRMTLMFCSFDVKPQILRLYGTARALHDGDEGWAELLDLFPDFVGARNIFDVAGLPRRPRHHDRLAGQEGRRRPARVRASQQPGQPRRPPDRTPRRVTR
jgi:hypothetical protein